jgi:hypothetical protein
MYDGRFSHGNATVHAWAAEAAPSGFLGVPCIGLLPRAAETRRDILSLFAGGI